MGLKTKLAMALISSAAGAAMIAGGSFALFSDTTTNSGNTFTAGTVTITDNTAAGAIFNGDALVGNLAPGDSGSTGSLSVTNSGTLDEWVGLKTTFSAVADSHNIFSDLSTVNGNAAGSDNHPLNISYSVVVKDPAGTQVGATIDHTVAVGGESTDQTPFSLPSGDTATITYSYTFDKAAGNDYQGAKGQVNVEVDAVQSRNNPLDATGQPVWS